MRACGSTRRSSTRRTWPTCAGTALERERSREGGHDAGKRGTAGGGARARLPARQCLTTGALSSRGRVRRGGVDVDEPRRRPGSVLEEVHERREPERRDERKR